MRKAGRRGMNLTKSVPEADWLPALRRKYGRRAEVRAQKRAALAGLNAQEESLLFHFPPPVERALVVGCGAGRELLSLAARGWQVTGIDLASPPLLAARKALARQGFSAELVHLATPYPWPFADGSFGAVLLLAQVLEHLPERAQRLAVLRETARTLLPGGLVYLGTHAISAADRDELRWLAPDAGRPETILAQRISRARSPGALPMHLYGREELCAEVAESGLAVLSWLVHEEPGEGHPVWRRFLYLAAYKQPSAAVSIQFTMAGPEGTRPRPGESSSGHRNG